MGVGDKEEENGKEAYKLTHFLRRARAAPPIRQNGRATNGASGNSSHQKLLL